MVYKPGNPFWVIRFLYEVLELLYDIIVSCYVNN